MNINWLRNTMIGIVAQEPALFSTSIEQNLKLGNDQINMKTMIDMCKMANAHEFIIKLPHVFVSNI